MSESVEKNSSSKELLERKKCNVCGEELLLEHPLKDANGNYFCPTHYKEFALAEGKKDQKPLLFD
jgi:formylmethanofuran dehydrogenase subunit E